MGNDLERMQEATSPVEKIKSIQVDVVILHLMLVEVEMVVETVRQALLPPVKEGLASL